MDERGKDSFDSKKSNDSNKKGVVQEKFESWKKAGKAVRKLLSSVNRNQHQSKAPDPSSRDGMNEMLQQYGHSYASDGLNNEDGECSFDCENCLKNGEEQSLSQSTTNESYSQEIFLDSPNGVVKHLSGKSNSCHTQKESLELTARECCNPSEQIAHECQTNNINQGIQAVMCQEKVKSETDGGLCDTDPKAISLKEHQTGVNCDLITGEKLEDHSEYKRSHLVEGKGENTNKLQDAETKKRWNILKEKIKKLTGRSPRESVIMDGPGSSTHSDNTRCDAGKSMCHADVVDEHKKRGKERCRTSLSKISDSSDSEDTCTQRYSYVRKKITKFSQTSLSKQKNNALPFSNMEDEQCNIDKKFQYDLNCSEDLSVIDISSQECGGASLTNFESYHLPAEFIETNEFGVSSQKSVNPSVESLTDFVSGTFANCGSTSSSQNTGSLKEGIKSVKADNLCSHSLKEGQASGRGVSLNDFLHQCHSDDETNLGIEQKYESHSRLLDSLIDNSSSANSSPLRQLHNVKASVEKLLLLNECIDDSRPDVEKLELNSFISEEELRCNVGIETDILHHMDETGNIQDKRSVVEVGSKDQHIRPEGDTDDIKQVAIDSYLSAETSEQSKLLDELQDKVGHLLQCNALRIGRLQKALEGSNHMTSGVCNGSVRKEETSKVKASVKPKEAAVKGKRLSDGMQGEKNKVKINGKNKKVERGGVLSTSCGSSSGEETDEEDNTLPDGLPTLVSSDDDNGKQATGSLTPMHRSPSNIQTELLESPDSLLMSYDSDLGEGLCDLDIQTSTEEDEPKVLISPREIDSLPELVSSSNTSLCGSEADDEFECDCGVCLTGKPHVDHSSASLLKDENEARHSSDSEERNELNRSQEYLVEYLPPEEYFGSEADLLLDDEDQLADSLFTSSVEWELPLSVHHLSPLELFVSQEGIWDLLAFMFQNVITQMLSVYPDLLSDRAPPPLTPDLINTIPVVTLDQAKIAQDSRCPICLCEFEEGEEARQLQCQHTFHILCISAWLAKSATCPVCRDVVRPETYQS